MLIFEFENGSIVNLLTFESIMTDGKGRFWMVCQSGTSYELSGEEFVTIKEIFKEKLQKI